METGRLHNIFLNSLDARGTITTAEGKMMRLVWLALVIALLAGCGSGGAAGNSVDPGPAPGPATAIVEFGTRAASAQTVLYAVEFVLHLPAGVTLPANPTSGEVPAGVLQTALSGALSGARYQPATAAAQALVRVNITDPGGFAVGDLATLTCNVAPGASLNPAGFSLAGFSARDANGAVITGITAHLGVKTQ